MGGFGDFFSGSAGGIIGGTIGAIGSLIGGNQSSNNAQALANMNYEAQKEFAQNGIRWKVADAKAAGIHPLYALGASTNSYSPVSGYGGDNGISDAFAQLGNGFSQGFDRAAQAKMTKEERAIAQAQLERQETMQLAEFNLRKEEMDAKNLMYKSEALKNYALAREAVKRSNLPPAMPDNKPKIIDGQGNAPTYDNIDIGGSYPFLQLSRMGNLLVEHVNPDLSDVVSESMFKSAVANISAEGQAGRTRQEAYRYLTPKERELVKQGKAGLYRLPGVGWQFLLSDELAPKYSDDRRSVSGKIIRMNVR